MPKRNVEIDLGWAVIELQSDSIVVMSRGLDPKDYATVEGIDSGKVTDTFRNNCIRISKATKAGKGT